MDNILFFQACEPIAGWELWKSDGSAAIGCELWFSDGTIPGQRCSRILILAVGIYSRAILRMAVTGSF